MSARFVLLFLGAASGALVLRPSAPLRQKRQATAPLLRAAPFPSASPSPRMLGSDDDMPRELPSDKLLKAVARTDGRVSAADVAVAAGLDLLETRRQLLVLARLVGAELEVSESGELVYRFDRNVYAQLRSASWKQRVREGWGAASPALFWLLRASFGVALLTSVAIAVTGVTVLSQQGKSDSKGGSSGSAPLMVPRAMFGPHPLDFLYYSRSPYYSTPGEMGFLQSCFSFLFGDGDPNADLSSRRARAVAALIRAEGGAVSAEQLAPLLAPPRPTEGGEAAGEAWVIEELVRFGGEPVVSEEGDIVYVFPELMKSAEERDGGALAPAGAVAAAMQHQVLPPAWRPRAGELVRVGALSTDAPLGVSRARWSQRVQALERLVGAEGMVVGDDRTGGLTPLEVSFASGQRRDGQSAYFMPEELLPANPSTALEEIPLRFSNAPPSQLVAAGALGGLNLAAVGYLGLLLRNARLVGVSAAALPTVRTLAALYPPLLLYALGFIAVPVARAALVRRRNQKIEERNRVRRAWAALLDSGASQSLRRKLAAAKKLRPGLRRLRRDESLFTSALPEEADAGGARLRPSERPSEQPSDAALGLDDFDERLRARVEGQSKDT